MGLNEERLFIKSIVCGKGLMYKKLEIKGRSRMGIIRVPKCQVKMVLEEKPLEEFYTLMLKGEAPQGFSDLLRNVAV